MSTAGVLRNGLASNVFVYTNTKVYVRERPSDPEAIGEYYPTGREKVQQPSVIMTKTDTHPPEGRQYGEEASPKSHSTHKHTRNNFP